jgi:SWIM zinc finger
MSEPAGRERTVRLVRLPTVDGAGIFCIDDANRTVFYAFHEIPCTIGGRGFAVHKLGLGTLYHVRVGRAADCSCECLGFLSRGNCRHILALLALVKQKLI